MMPTFYCRFRDESSGKLLAWQSTGETAYGRAESWAIAKLGKESPPSASTLEGFAKDFFKWDTSLWIRKQH